MAFFNKHRGIKGFVTTYNHVLRFKYMISEIAKRRIKILSFYEKHGLEATKEAFNISRATIFRWQRALKDKHGKLDGLNAKSKAPKNRRKRIVDDRVTAFVIEQRKLHYRIGKKKLATMVFDEYGIKYSESKIGRIINDLKRRELLPKYGKISMYARSGQIRQRIIKKRKKLRIKDYKPENSGDLLQIDTVVKFINGIKRYIITAIDVESDFSFALAYTSLSSKSSSDFMKKLQNVVPFTIKRVQTDNGLEFEKYFREYLEKKNIIHFYNYPKCPKMNAFVERFNRTIQEDFINSNLMSLRDDLERFNHDLIEWLLWYNTKRPHESLGMVSPLKYIVSTLPARKSHMWWTRTLP
jgi:putative transposase